jgi:hypothetical protein
LCLEPLLNDVFSNDSLNELLLNDYAVFFVWHLFFAHTYCLSHRSLILIQRSKNKNLKTEISRITNPFSSVFLYKKRYERDRERKKKEKRDTKEIKTEIRPFQLQTTITFDRKLRLRRSMWPQKANDEIYRVKC